MEIQMYRQAAWKDAWRERVSDSVHWEQENRTKCGSFDGTARHLAAVVLAGVGESDGL